MPSPHARTLVLAILTVESSYQNRQERDAGEIPDTVQFWLEDDGVWRVRTYAVDHDIHVHHLVGVVDSETKPRLPQLEAHLERAYEGVLGPVYVLNFEDYTDAEAVRRELDAQSLPGELQTAEAGFYFYNPDGGEYRSQSEPA